MSSSSSSSWGDKWKIFTAKPGAQKAGQFYKKAETGVWRVLDPIGRGANRLAGRAGAESFWPTELAEGELDKAARILRTFALEGARPDAGVGAAETSTEPVAHDNEGGTKDEYASRKTQKVLKKIPPKALQGACGVAIMTCFRTGFGFSGAGGSGIVVARLPDGSWGPPSGILIHTLGWGFLIGLDIYDVVLVLRKPQALKAFEHPKVAIGGEISVAAGPVGNGAILDGGVEAAPCWSYTKSKGAYAGLQLDGTIILKRDDANARLYGGPISVSDLFRGKVPAPAAAKPLLQTLYAAEGRPQVLGTEQIPTGLTPGDTEITAEEAEALKDNTNEKTQTEQYDGDHGGDRHDERPSATVPRAHRVPPPFASAASPSSTAASADHFPPEKEYKPS